MNAVERLIESHPAHGTGHAESPSLTQARARALATFQACGFPNTKVEDWKYTSTKALRDTGFVLDNRSAVGFAPPEEVTWAQPGDVQLVFVNGTLHREWSHLPQQEGLKLTELAEATGPILETSEDPFSALNLAFAQDGIHIEIPANTTVVPTIYVLFIGKADDTPMCAHPRVCLSVGRNAQATLVQTHIHRGDAPAWINAVVQMQVAPNANLTHYIVHQGAEHLHYVGNIGAHVERDGAYHSHAFWMGGTFARNDIRVELTAPGADTQLNGLYLTGGSEHVDNHTTIEHQQPHCTSNELYKGVLGGMSKAVFNGRIVVHKDAQKTDSAQSNRNLLLSEKATINTKPELEIYADDVSCAHGTTVGQMDEEALFYLRSRGIGAHQAKQILTRAFCQELIDQIPAEALRDRLHAMVDTRLADLTEAQS